MTVPPTRRLWLVGKNTAQSELGVVWEFMGLFEEEYRAAAACSTPWHFVAPVLLNEQLPEETIPWDGLYFPLPFADGVT